MELVETFNNEFFLFTKQYQYDRVYKRLQTCSCLPHIVVQISVLGETDRRRDLNKLLSYSSSLKLLSFFALKLVI